MTQAETNTVEQTLRISARPETVWRYWTDPDRMCEWWGAAAELDPRPGGAYVVEMGGGGVMRGEFVELVPYERIVFSFGFEPAENAPPITAGSTLVEVTLAADGADTILTLRHSGIPAAHADEHSAGWSHTLPLLAEVAGAQERDARP